MRQRTPTATTTSDPGDTPRRDRPGWAGRSGFTLIELLAVIAIVGVLAALLVPVLARTKATAKKVQCVSNLRQMAIAAQVFVDNHEGSFPKAYWMTRENGVTIYHAWDLTTIHDERPRVVPGVLWEGTGVAQIHQCPSFEGAANWLKDPYTGYNYNTSYLGHGQFESTPEPAKVNAIRKPAQTVVFGDGQYAGGANKFMRAPYPSPGDRNFHGRWSGTQGFRHAGRSNASFADGHVESLRDRYTANADGEAKIAEGTGFLSEGNTLYDLN